MSLLIKAYWTFKNRKGVSILKSLRFKFILSFTVITLVLSLLCAFTYLAMNFTINQMDNMIDTTILANGVYSEIEDASLINNYILHKKPEDKAKIQQSLVKMQSDYDSIKDVKTDDENVLQNVKILKSLIVNYKENAELVLSAMEKGDLTKAMEAKEKTVKARGFIKGAVDDFVRAELQRQGIEKIGLNSQAQWTWRIVLFAMILCMAVSILYSILFSNKIAGMISKLAKYAQNIAEGNLNVSRIEVSSKDDIAILAHSFNKMGEHLQNVIGSIGLSSSKVAQAADMLKSNAEQSTAAIQQVAASIQQVAEGAAEQSEQSNLTVEVVNALYEGNKKVYENAGKVFETSERATIAANVGNDKMHKLLDQINIIEEKIVGTQRVTQTLKNNSNEIKKVLDTITSIASQTNLLALNASIEAARAGEHGKGFAVVAGEVGKLAEGSANATREITSMLMEIQKDSQQVAESMSVGVNEVKDGLVMAGEARAAFEEIVSTSKDVDIQVKLITQEIERMVGEIQRVEEMSKSILEIANKSASGSHEVASAVEEQTASLQEITSSSIVLSEMADELKQMVSKFRL